jgi:geranylgeranyl pyrophosphate synthase
MEVAETLSRHAASVEVAINRLLPPAETPPGRLHEAMRYSMLAGGKRLRPVLVVAAAEVFSENGGADPLAAAVAVECVHTYSLIHDDLPCMDNDDLRRGRPTAHKAFDEATALLAGDALLTHAFALLAVEYAAEPALAQALVRELGEAAGSRRLVGGQMADLLAEKKDGTSPGELSFIHLNKTAAMIEAALVMGGMCGRASDRSLDGLRRAGRELGLAFQIVDDVLDATATSAALGKTAGKDARAGKATFVALYGIDGSKRFAEEHSRAAASALRELPGNADFLVGLAESLARRTK